MNEQARILAEYERREREVPAALRIAMLEARDKHPHPYYWAPFVIVGKAFHAAC